MYKKLLVITAGILLVLIFAVGCSDKSTGGVSPSNTVSPSPAGSGTVQPSTGTSNSPSQSPSVSPSDMEQKVIIDDFQALLKAPGNEKAAITLMLQNVSKLSPKNADQMVLSLEAYQNEALTQQVIIDDALIKMVQASKDPYNEQTLNDLSKITDPALKTALQAVFDKGYKLIVPEGMYQPVINYGVYTASEKFVSPDIAAYISIMAKESEQRMLEDAAIIIPVDEVFARTLAAESFITTYPDSVKYDQMHQKFSNYVDTYFFGQNNTPAFDYQTDKLNQEFLDSYNKAAASGKDTTFVTAVSEYLKILKDNNYTLTETVTDYRKSITNGLKNTAS